MEYSFAMKSIGHQQFVHFFGAVTLMYMGFRFIHGVYRFFQIYFTKSDIDYKSFGKWALVTGSTDGIGKGIAFELARRGLNIVLVSRNPTKLEAVAMEIEKEFMVETRCIAIDFAKCEDIEDENIQSRYDAVTTGITGLEIGILVNNVGLGASGEFLNAFSKSDDKDISTGLPRLIYCNDMSMSRVTAIVLPQMVGRKKGLVINVSSLAALIVMPNTGVYSSSKRFNDTFTKALRREYQSKGIIFQSVQPGVVRTNMTSGQNKKSTKTYPDSHNYAQHLMESIGKDIETAGYHYHGLLRIIITFFPEWMVSRLLLKARRKK